MEIAAAWYRLGQRELGKKNPDAAVAAFRKATVNDNSRQLYTESLSQALLLAGRSDEARQLLLQLRESAPDNPQVNLALARLAAGKHDLPETLRYYHNALYGIWTGDNVNERQRDVRAELINFLLHEQAHDQALAEILVLAYHLPNDVPSHLELGAMFTRVGDLPRSYPEFSWVLHREPHNQLALAGAGAAAFQMRRYREAERLLEQVSSKTQPVQETLDLAKLVVSIDPLDMRAVYGQRSQRLLSDFDHAAANLNSCIARNSAQNTENAAALSAKMSGMKFSLTLDKLRRSPDLVFPALELIYQVETESARACGPLQPSDHALLLVGQKGRGEQ